MRVCRSFVGFFVQLSVGLALTMEYFWEAEIAWLGGFDDRAYCSWNFATTKAAPWLLYVEG